MEDLSQELDLIYEDIGRAIGRYSYPSPGLIEKFKEFRLRVLEIDRIAYERGEPDIRIKTENLYSFLVR